MPLPSSSIEFEFERYTRPAVIKHKDLIPLIANKIGEERISNGCFEILKFDILIQSSTDMTPNKFDYFNWNCWSFCKLSIQQSQCQLHSVIQFELDMMERGRDVTSTSSGEESGGEGAASFHVLWAKNGAGGEGRCLLAAHGPLSIHHCL